MNIIFYISYSLSLTLPFSPCCHRTVTPYHCTELSIQYRRCARLHTYRVWFLFLFFFLSFFVIFDENIISCRILFSYKWKLICCAWGIEETLGERNEHTPESVNMSFLFFRSMPAQSAWRYVNARLILLFFAKWMPITATSNVHAFFWLRKVPRIRYFL